MSVMIDSQPLAAEEMGLSTVGEVLTHIQKDNRLVVQVLLDGRAPDLGRIAALRGSPLGGHTLYIETARPSEMALEVLDEACAQLDEADRLKADTCGLLQRNQMSEAMQNLSGCFSRWQHAQDAVLKTAQLLRVNLDALQAGGAPLIGRLNTFAQQLRQIKASLESRDYVSLSDVLTYEMDGAVDAWRLAIDALRATVKTPVR